MMIKLIVGLMLFVSLTAFGETLDGPESPERYDEKVPESDWQHIAFDKVNIIDIYISKNESIVDKERKIVQAVVLIDLRRTNDPKKFAPIPNTAFERQMIVLDCNNRTKQQVNTLVLDNEDNVVQMRTYPREFTPFPSKSISAHICNRIVQFGTET